MGVPNNLLSVVGADLTYLRAEWNERIDDDSLRRGSAVLRRLLVDGDLQRAWKMAGFAKEPQIGCATLRQALKSLPLGRIDLASAGGTRFGGAELTGFMQLQGAMSAEEARARYEQGIPREVVGLRTFVESPCIVVRGEPVVRRVLIKYVANKLGGAHHDGKRGTAHEEQLYALLDGVQFELLQKPIAYFELLGLGQSLASSEDIERLRQAADLAKVSPRSPRRV